MNGIEQIYELYKDEGDPDLLAERLFALSAADASEFFRVFRFSPAEMDALRDSVAAYYFICRDDDLKSEFGMRYDTGYGSFFAMLESVQAVWDVFARRQYAADIARYRVQLNRAEGLIGELRAEVARVISAAKRERDDRSGNMASLSAEMSALKNEITALSRSAEAERRTFVADIATSILPQYRDFTENGEDGCTPENYAALRADLRNIFKSLKRLGVTFDEH